MSRRPRLFTKVGLSAVLLGLACLPAAAQNWPQFYDPLVVRTLNLTLSASDWDVVRNDESFTVEVPAQLSLPGETPILVAVRRKSSIAITAPGRPTKVSLKIDINQYVEQSWHGMKKLSLENGADVSTLKEGFAWYLHRLAWTSGGYPYMPPLASWAKVNVNGQSYGVYVNVEQVDKRFLEWRGVWLSDDTWLYKQSELGGAPTIEFGPLTPSPTYTALCYSPFPPQSCPTPAAATVATQLASLIDMQGMLTMGAVNGWCYSPDALFSKGKNFFHSDSRYRKRLYYPWDLDASFGSLSPSTSIFNVGTSPYEDVILANPTFRTQYKAIMQTLLSGAFATTNLISALNSLETALLPEMSADPYNPGSAGDFTALRNYASARNTNVASQLASDGNVSVETSALPPAVLLTRPNPTSSESSITFSLDRAGPVRVSVYDAQGTRVRTLIDQALEAGIHHVEWQGTNDDGRPMAAGVYFVSCRIDGRTWSQKVALFR